MLREIENVQERIQQQQQQSQTEKERIQPSAAGGEEDRARKMMRKFEALLVPFPTQGHMNPMMQLALCFLQHQDFCVSFVITEFNFRCLQQSSSTISSLQIHESFRFLVVSDGLPADDPRNDVTKLYQVARDFMMPFVEARIIHDLYNDNGQGTRTVVVADALAAGVLASAQSSGIPNASLWTSATACCAQLCTVFELIASSSIPENGVFKEDVNQMVDFNVPTVPSISCRDLPWVSAFTEPEQESFIQGICGYMPFLRKSDWLLCNSVYELESPVFDFLVSKGIPASAIGPLQIACGADFSSGLRKEDVGCLEWLDKQPPRSVIYVSFGSLAGISAAQFKELALGLDMTGLPFLWVVRDDLVKDSDSQGGGSVCAEELIEKLKNDKPGGWGKKSFVVSWCSQMKVLGHPSVACFITHCGWNSTLEAIFNGIPMLCWPCFGDQPLNSTYVVDVWKVGLKLQALGKKGLVQKQDIKTAINKIVDGQEGSHVRKNMLEVQKCVQAAVAKTGSSVTNFSDFLDTIRARLARPLASM